jgi:hypothetical protein
MRVGESMKLKKPLSSLTKNGEKNSKSAGVNYMQKSVDPTGPTFSVFFYLD